jgi:transposase
MDLAAELAQFNPDPALAAWVGKLLDKSKNDALKIQALTLELAYYKRIRFANKSEQFSAEQRELFEESWNTDTSAQEAEVEQLSPSQPVTRVRAGRQPLPEHLLRIEHRHEPDSCTCGQCGKDLVKIGEDISEQLDVEPARFFVHRHIRTQYACRACETITAAPIPAAIIDGGMAAPGLLTWVMISKFQDHLPLYRLEQIAARQQVPLARSTLAEWVGLFVPVVFFGAWLLIPQPDATVLQTKCKDTSNLTMVEARSISATAIWPPQSAACQPRISVDSLRGCSQSIACRKLGHEKEIPQ